MLQNLEAFVLTLLLLRRTVNLLFHRDFTSQLSLGALLGLPECCWHCPWWCFKGIEQVVVREVMDRWT